MPTDKKTLDWYNANAAAYAKPSAFHWALEKPAMYKLLPKIKNKIVLSVGCGHGDDVAELKKRGAKRAVGIDLSEKLLDIARKNHAECEFIAMDMERLDFEDETFDFAYSSLAMHYPDDWHKALKEIHRVLKPGSFFLFSREHPIWTAQPENADTKGLNGARIIYDYLNPQELGGMGDMDVTTHQQPISLMINDLTETGFQIIRCEEPKPTEDFKKEAEQSIYEVLTRIPIFIIFKCQKPK